MQRRRGAARNREERRQGALAARSHADLSYQRGHRQRQRREWARSRAEREGGRQIQQSTARSAHGSGTWHGQGRMTDQRSSTNKEQRGWSSARTDGEARQTKTVEASPACMFRGSASTTQFGYRCARSGTADETRASAASRSQTGREGAETSAAAWRAWTDFADDAGSTTSMENGSPTTDIGAPEKAWGTRGVYVIRVDGAGLRFLCAIYCES